MTDRTKSAAGPWISVADQMPPRHTTALVRFADGSRLLVEDWCACQFCVEEMNATHWAELNEPEGRFP